MNSTAAAAQPRWQTSLLGLGHSARRIAPLAWPYWVGQLAVLAFVTVDTVLVARYAAVDLAALAVGSAAYVTVFIGLMGVVLALAPIVGHQYGAGQLQQAGRQAHQAVWVALGLGVVGSSLLVFPTPFLALAQVTPEIEAKVRGFMLALAFSLPASLLFGIYRGFNTAVSRPKAVMVLQLMALAVKVPMSLLLVFGAPSWGIPAWGAVGCGMATCVAVWAQLLGAAIVLRRDPFYRAFDLPFMRPRAPSVRQLDRPQRQLLGAHLRLGVPMGASILIEVSGFAFMALFISRLGTTPVAGHQLAVNLVSVLFMVPLAIGNAAGTLVAQRIGAQDSRDARQLGWHGLLIGCLLAAVMGGAVYAAREPVLGLYTRDPLVLAAALPLVAWVALFHVADAAQTVAAFVLRAYRIAVVPVVIYVAALWGVGLGGGYVLAFNPTGQVPQTLQGARGFWFASTAGLVLAGVALSAFMLWMMRRERRLERQVEPA